MRHRKIGRKFGRTPAHRRAMFRNLATSLFEHEKIETTIGKAKDLRRVSEKLITLAGEDTLAARRQAYGYINSKAVVHKLFAEIGPRFKERPGGYTRVVRTRRRAGDVAEMAIIELVQEDYKPKKKTSKKKAGAKKAASKKAAPKADAAPATEAAAEPTEEKASE